MVRFENLGLLGGNRSTHSTTPFYSSVQPLLNWLPVATSTMVYLKEIK